MSRQNALPDPHTAYYYERKQSLSSTERLDVGLTLQTREGDVVTLRSGSYSRMDAFLYDSRGALYTDTGRILVNQSVREITLASGESFFFSVEGDLSEEEFKDIEAVVKGIDQVISRMKAGEMGEAVDAALSMGEYATVSGFSADITLEKTQTLASSIAAGYSDRASGYGYARNPLESGNSGPADQWLAKMMEPVASMNQKLWTQIPKPVNRLFTHHLRGVGNAFGQDHALYRILEKTGERMDRLIAGLDEKTV